MTKDQINCAANIKVDTSGCPNKCEGMDIISYNEIELDSKLTRRITSLSLKNDLSRFQMDPNLDKSIIKLTKQYANYKNSYNFSSEFRSIQLLLVNIKIYTITELSFRIQVSVKAPLCQDCL